MHGIEKRFGSVHALKGVDFALAEGEVHVLLGVNGAGKSTLIKILSGIYRADAGRISVAGVPIDIASPADAIAAGVASVQQHPELVDDFSGYENIFLGHESESRGLLAAIDRTAMERKARELLERFPFEVDLSVPVGQLSGVEREMVAILHSLKQENSHILILDEPTSTLTNVEKAELFKVIEILKSSGMSVIYITHRLEEVFEIGDRFTVFRGGERVASMSCAEAQEDAVSIPDLMLASEMGDLFPPRRTPEVAEEVLSVSDLSGPGFDGMSFSVRKGEILGLFGLVGSGIDALAKTLFGAAPADAGQMVYRSEPTRFSSPREALAKGVFLVPGDRRSEGLVMTENVVFNTVLANITRASGMGGLMRFFRNRKETAGLTRDVDLSPPRLNSIASEFSGGNQQKIVVAKGLYRQAELYIFVEPTVGVDIGARARIYAMMRQLSKSAAVIVMSSDCDEAYGIADTAGALYRGRMALAPSAGNSRNAVLEAGLSGRAA